MVLVQVLEYVIVEEVRAVLIAAGLREQPAMLMRKIEASRQEAVQAATKLVAPFVIVITIAASVPLSKYIISV